MVRWKIVLQTYAVAFLIVLNFQQAFGDLQEPYVNEEYGEVMFRGVTTTNEEWSEFVCYGSYYCNVAVEEILYDSNNTLSLEDVVTVCYNESLSLEIGDQVECYGYYWKTIGPLQCVGKVACIGNDYYVIPEFPALVMLTMCMIATLLPVKIYRRRHTK